MGNYKGLLNVTFIWKKIGFRESPFLIFYNSGFSFRNSFNVFVSLPSQVKAKLYTVHEFRIKNVTK